MTKIYVKFQVWHIFPEEGNQPNSRYFKLVELEPTDRYFQGERFPLRFWHNHITAPEATLPKSQNQEGSQPRKS